MHQKISENKEKNLRGTEITCQKSHNSKHFWYSLFFSLHKNSGDWLHKNRWMHDFWLTMHFLLFPERFQQNGAVGCVLKLFCFVYINFHLKDAPAHSFLLFTSLVEFQILGNRNKHIQNSLSECFSRPLHFDVISWKDYYPFFPYYLSLANRNGASTGTWWYQGRKQK